MLLIVTSRLLFELWLPQWPRSKITRNEARHEAAHRRFVDKAPVREALLSCRGFDDAVLALGFKTQKSVSCGLDNFRLDGGGGHDDDDFSLFRNDNDVLESEKGAKQTIFSQVSHVDTHQAMFKKKWKQKSF